MLTEM
ncbi:rCG22934 [Rattus norvegicus]